MLSSEFEPSIEHEILSGEEPATEELEDVEHWIAVYTELVAGARRLQAATPQPDGRLESELGRLQARLSFWLGRRTALDA